MSYILSDVHRSAKDDFYLPAAGSPSAGGAALAHARRTPVEGQRCGDSKEDMAVEFKANDVSYRGMSQYQNGQSIPCVRFKTEVLPRGTPTDRFKPYICSSGKYFLVDVAVEVQPNKIILYALNKGQAVRKDVPGYAISHALFQGGMPAAMVHDGKEFPGILRPLSALPRTP
jgi:hypothetical protein